MTGRGDHTAVVGGGGRGSRGAGAAGGDRGGGRCLHYGAGGLLRAWRGSDVVEGEG